MGNVSFDKNMTQISFGFVHFAHFAFKYKFMSNRISSLRKEYMMAHLDEAQVAKLPLEQFNTWFAEALQSEVLEANAMMLATVNGSGQPSARIVLLKDIYANGICFFSNYTSRKGQELDIHPKAALTFFWPDLERQVRFEGTVVKISREKSEAYFAKRPRGSQIGAWTSPQSEKIQSRQVIEEAEQTFTNQFTGEEVPCPPHWGGYLLEINYAEFWQGRASRLHDRISYQMLASGEWERFRLAP
jgi:pyridoxamine 5'-phosphate oxidase